MQIVDSFVLSKYISYPYEPRWFLDAEKRGEIEVLWLSDGGLHGADDPIRQSYAFGVRMGNNVVALDGATVYLTDSGKILVG